MASEIDICNLALSNLGDDTEISSINPTDGSVQSERCARYYPIARNALLEANNNGWSFATKRQALASAADAPPDSWQFAYNMPSDCVRPLAILLPQATDDTAVQDFSLETNSTGQKVIYTNVETATLKYTRLVTDTTQFPQLVVIALARLLSASLAGVTVKGAGGVRLSVDQYKIAAHDLSIAMAADANSSRSAAYKDFTPSGVAARA